MRSLSENTSWRAACCLAVTLLSSTAWAEDPQPLALTTLEWPPYTRSGPDPGQTRQAVQTAALLAGLDFQTVVLPWKRAVKVGLDSPGYQGYYPEYRSATLTGTCLFSDPVGSGPLGLVHRMDRPILWNTLADLKGYRLGTVQGYVNTEAFDQMAASGLLTVEAAIDDATNLRKVLGRRIDAAVIDLNVFRYAMQAEPELVGHENELQASPTLIETKTLHVCFRATAEAARLRDRFNEGLKAALASGQAIPDR